MSGLTMFLLVEWLMPLVRIEGMETLHQKLQMLQEVTLTN